MPTISVNEFWGFFPIGTILPFAGDLDQRPPGWQVCDGTKYGDFTTTNLVGRLPIGLPSDAPLASVGATDGPKPDNPTHTHGFTQGQQTGQDTPGGIEVSTDGSTWAAHSLHYHSLANITTDPSSSLPPVTRVYFIQKVV